MGRIAAVSGASLSNNYFKKIQVPFVANSLAQKVEDDFDCCMQCCETMKAQE